MSAVTSKLNQISIGKGKDKKEIYTATKVTPTTDLKGNKTYVMEVVQYDNANGEGGEVIGIRNGNEITWNDSASEDITGDAKAIKKINKESKSQAKKVQKDLTKTAGEDRAFNKANDKGNEGTEYENQQNEPKLSSVDAGVDAVAKAGESVVGTRESGFGSYVFPKTLRDEGPEGQDYLKFDMMKYQPKKFSKDKFSFNERSHNEKDTDKRSIGTVILPIPGGIQDATAVGWGGQKMTPLDMAKANIALTGVTEGIGQAVSETGGMAKNLAKAMGDNSDALAAVIAGMAAGGQQLLTRTTGAISNPNMELLFNGPDLRTFSFQFLLAPRDKKEAMDVIKIIRFFKQGMAPIRTKSRLFMKSPHTFRLSYRNSKGEQHKFLNKFKECALGSFGVNYAPNGNYSTYEDGVMTAYQMSMTYRELNPIYNDDYGDKSVNGKLPAEIGF
tara:strand:- start:574 stop:1905 length:1332 start_codon:yes stop_codon:yes gene_type:complete